MVAIQIIRLVIEFVLEAQELSYQLFIAVKAFCAHCLFIGYFYLVLHWICLILICFQGLFSIGLIGLLMLSGPLFLLHPGDLTTLFGSWGGSLVPEASVRSRLSTFGQELIRNSVRVLYLSFGGDQRSHQNLTLKIEI